MKPIFYASFIKYTPSNSWYFLNYRKNILEPWSVAFEPNLQELIFPFLTPFPIFWYTAKFQETYHTNPKVNVILEHQARMEFWGAEICGVIIQTPCLEFINWIFTASWAFLKARNMCDRNDLSFKMLHHDFTNHVDAPMWIKYLFTKIQYYDMNIENDFGKIIDYSFKQKSFFNLGFVKFNATYIFNPISQDSAYYEKVYGLRNGQTLKRIANVLKHNESPTVLKYINMMMDFIQDQEFGAVKQKLVEDVVQHDPQNLFKLAAAEILKTPNLGYSKDFNF
jgi:hypothetical protein